MGFYVILGSWAIMTGNVFIKKYDFFSNNSNNICIGLFVIVIDKVESSYFGTKMHMLFYTLNVFGCDLLFVI